MDQKELTRKDGVDNAWEYLNRATSDDLAPAKGIFWACVLTSAFWIIVISLIVAVRQ